MVTRRATAPLQALPQILTTARAASVVALTQLPLRPLHALHRVRPLPLDHRPLLPLLLRRALLHLAVLSPLPRHRPQAMPLPRHTAVSRCLFLVVCLFLRHPKASRCNLRAQAMLATLKQVLPIQMRECTLVTVDNLSLLPKVARMDTHRRKCPRGMTSSNKEWHGVLPVSSKEIITRGGKPSWARRETFSSVSTYSVVQITVYGMSCILISFLSVAPGLVFSPSLYDRLVLPLAKMSSPHALFMLPTPLAQHSLLPPILGSFDK